MTGARARSAGPCRTSKRARRRGDAAGSMVRPRWSVPIASGARLAGATRRYAAGPTGIDHYPGLRHLVGGFVEALHRRLVAAVRSCRIGRRLQSHTSQIASCGGTQPSESSTAHDSVRRWWCETSLQRDRLAHRSGARGACPRQWRCRLSIAAASAASPPTQAGPDRVGSTSSDAVVEGTVLVARFHRRQTRLRRSARPNGRGGSGRGCRHPRWCRTTRPAIGASLLPRIRGTARNGPLL